MSRVSFCICCASSTMDGVDFTGLMTVDVARDMLEIDRVDETVTSLKALPLFV